MTTTTDAETTETTTTTPTSKVKTVKLPTWAELYGHDGAPAAPEDGTRLAFPVDALRTALRWAGTIASRSKDNRPVLQGVEVVAIVGHEGQVVQFAMAGTDSYQLHAFTTERGGREHPLSWTRCEPYVPDNVDATAVRFRLDGKQAVKAAVELDKFKHALPTPPDARLELHRDHVGVVMPLSDHVALSVDKAWLGGEFPNWPDLAPPAPNGPVDAGPVGFTPAFLVAIDKACGKDVGKYTPVQFTYADTRLKPVTYRVDVGDMGVCDGLLMPVRLT
jgi:hypothetical protein